MRRLRKRGVAKRKLAPSGRRRAMETAPVRRAVQLGSGLAPGMQTINTYLAVANVAASIEFLERTLGFARGVVLGDGEGQLHYAEMRHGPSVVMLVRKSDPTSATGGVSALYTYVDDVDTALGRARTAGAGVEDAEEKPWGDRAGAVTDPDGHRWVLATFKKFVAFE